jgi:carboxyl-terminal processing protease
MRPTRFSYLLSSVFPFPKQIVRSPYQERPEGLVLRGEPRAWFVRTLLFVACVAALSQVSLAQEPNPLALRDRVLVASKIYHSIETYFGQWRDGSQQGFEAAYQAYLDRVLKTENRREFSLATMELFATLRSGHTWFRDQRLQELDGQPVGLKVASLEGQWVVTRSDLAALKSGDLIVAIDGLPMEDFFSKHRNYISASSERDARSQLFGYAVLFPQRFTLTLADGVKIAIDRAHDHKIPRPARKTEGRWLIPKVVAYIKIPSFDDIGFQATAQEYVNEFRNAKTLVIDLRGNGGGRPESESNQLQSDIMGQPYRWWRESYSLKAGAIGSRGAEYPQFSYGETWKHPSRSIFKGKVIILTDRDCASACESFVMPFKDSGRAKLIGEDTAGTYAETVHPELDTGMEWNIATAREDFPDGSTFEGVGIRPDISILATPEDLRSANDRVLQKALEIARAD